MFEKIKKIFGSFKSLPEIIKNLRLIDIKNYIQFFIDYHPTKTQIDKLEVSNIVNKITPNQLEEIKKLAIETAEEVSKIKGILESSQDFKEALAKTIISETILINLSTLKQKVSKGLIKFNPNASYTMFVRCGKCGKFFNSGIGGNLQSLANSTFLNNLHQCQYCGNMQLAKDNSDYFISLQKTNL